MINYTNVKEISYSKVLEVFLTTLDCVIIHHQTVEENTLREELFDSEYNERKVELLEILNETISLIDSYISLPNLNKSDKEIKYSLQMKTIVESFIRDLTCRFSHNLN